MVGPDAVVHALLAMGGVVQHAPQAGAAVDAAVVAVDLPPLMFSSTDDQVADARLVLHFATDDAQQQHQQSVVSVLKSWSVWEQHNSMCAVDVTIGERATLPAPVAAFGSPTRPSAGIGVVPRWLRIRDVTVCEGRVRITWGTLDSRPAPFSDDVITRVCSIDATCTVASNSWNPPTLVTPRVLVAPNPKTKRTLSNELPNQLTVSCANSEALQSVLQYLIQTLAGARCCTGLSSTAHPQYYLRVPTNCMEFTALGFPYPHDLFPTDFTNSTNTLIVAQWEPLWALTRFAGGHMDPGIASTIRHTGCLMFDLVNTNRSGVCAVCQHFSSNTLSSTTSRNRTAFLSPEMRILYQHPSTPRPSRGTIAQAHAQAHAQAAVVLPTPPAPTNSAAHAVHLSRTIYNSNAVVRAYMIIRPVHASVLFL